MNGFVYIPEKKDLEQRRAQPFQWDSRGFQLRDTVYSIRNARYSVSGSLELRCGYTLATGWVTKEEQKAYGE